MITGEACAISELEPLDPDSAANWRVQWRNTRTGQTGQSLCAVYTQAEAEAWAAAGNVAWPELHHIAVQADVDWADGESYSAPSRPQP